MKIHSIGANLLLAVFLTAWPDGHYAYGGNDMKMIQMRPDMAPPQGITGGMTPGPGRLMLSFKYTHMKMDGNRDGTDRVSTSSVLANYMVAPLRMDMDMLMFGAMYGITNDLSVMGMLPYVEKEMDHITRMGAKFTTNSEGIGDPKLIVNYRFLQRDRISLSAGLGLSLPLGSIDEKDATPAGPGQPLPYPMQIGSGTFDLLPSVTYGGRSDFYSWGAQLSATLRLDENDRDYTLGNQYQAGLWAARKWNDWLSSSLRLQWQRVEDIDGADPRLIPTMVPTADPDLRAGSRLDLGIGLNFLVPSGPLQGVRLGVELVAPIYQNLNGPQIEADYVLSVGLSKAF